MPLRLVYKLVPFARTRYSWPYRVAGSELIDSVDSVDYAVGEDPVPRRASPFTFIIVGVGPEIE